MAPKRKPQAKKGAIKLPRQEKAPAKDPNPSRNQRELSESSDNEEEVPPQSTVGNQSSMGESNVANVDAGIDESEDQSEEEEDHSVEEEEEDQSEEENHNDVDGQEQPRGENNAASDDDSGSSDAEDEQEHINLSESEDDSSDSEEESDDSEIENIPPSEILPRVQNLTIRRNRRSYNGLGLTLSCKKFARYIRSTSSYRWSKNSIVYLTACVEYVLGQIVENLIEEVRKDRNKKRITPRHLMKAVMNDLDLRNAECWPNAIFAGAGVMEGVHPALFAPRNMARNMPAVPGKALMAVESSQRAQKRVKTGNKPGTSRSQGVGKKRRLQPKHPLDSSESDENSM